MTTDVLRMLCNLLPIHLPWSAAQCIGNCSSFPSLGKMMPLKVARALPVQEYTSKMLSCLFCTDPPSGQHIYCGPLELETADHIKEAFAFAHSIGLLVIIVI